ncbi:hypothetical protein [Acidilobus saccharovorans]|uniref:hypothetical protein n=1 Tax=Acidilobus saccharovorans TaxID=242703 RepID=UPI0011D10296|nr:hypothetical protein [Acidilobus saccharovorans]
MPDIEVPESTRLPGPSITKEASQGRAASGEDLVEGGRRGAEVASATAYCTVHSAAQAVKGRAGACRARQGPVIRALSPGPSL